MGRISTKLVVDILYIAMEYEGFYPSIYDSPGTTGAENVLKVLEDAGMLAPGYVINEDTTERDVINEWKANGITRRNWLFCLNPTG